jgi:hypothetical protein
MAGGRPSKYDTHIKPYLREIRQLRAIGTEYSKIAQMLHIGETTLYKHKGEIEEFAESIKKGDNQLVDEMEATLYDLAKGKVVRKKSKINYNADGKILNREETTEELAPNLGALIFSLTNLAPDKWKNKQSVTTMPYDEIEEDMEDYEK